MKISLDYPDELDAEVMQKAKDDGHKNRSAVIRKALTFYLSAKSHKVALDRKTSRRKTMMTTV